MTEPAFDAADAAGRLLTRRRLVQAGTAAGAALYLGGLASTASASGDVPAFLTRSGYRGLTGSTFTATGPAGIPATLTLTDVADLARTRSEPAFAGREDAFALTFSGPRDAVLASGIHELSHPVLGRFSLFITPVGETGGGQRYEVVVDRSVRLATASEQAPAPLAHTNAAVATAPAAAAAPARSGRAGTQAHRPVKLVRSAGLARRAGILTCDVRVAPHHGLVSARATLLRDGVEYARAARLLRGKAGVRLNMRELRKVPAGEYDLRVTVTDVRGRRTVTTRRATVR